LKNSDRFLVAFNSIEMAIKEYSNGDYHVPFSRLIQIARVKNGVVNKFYDDLKEFNELRNAIVHNSIDVNHAIAEPHDDVVEKIEYIEREIKQPKRVIPLFQKKVLTFQSSDSLMEMLKAIKRYAYSKFPIYEEQTFIGLLTKKGIVNWMARHVEELDSISFSRIIIKDVLCHENKNDNYQFIDRLMTIYDVKETFKNPLEKKSPRIDALLITEHGKKDESLLGMITPWDLIHM